MVYSNFVKEYWGKADDGKLILDSNQFSNEDLLFLIPNNKLRMAGMKPSRCMGSKKKLRKIERRSTLSFKSLLIPGIFESVFPQEFIDEMRSMFLHPNDK